MSIVELVKPDEATVKFLADYKLLVDANNALGLEAITTSDPVVVSHEQDVVDLCVRRQELSDNISRAATQLKAHYDGIAEEDPDFKQYLEQETTFKQTLEDFPEIQRRKMFESFGKFFERNQLEERLAIDRRLEYFRPSYVGKNYPMIPTSEKDVLKLFRKHVRGNVATSCVAVPAYLGMGYFSSHLSRHSSLSDKLDLIYTCMITACYAAAVGFPILVNKVTNKEYGKKLEEFIHKPMQRKAQYADRLIETINQYAK